MIPYKKICSIKDAKWKEHRLSGIGGSEAAAVIGANPWKPPIEVFMEKMRLSESNFDNEKMYWGTILEPIVAKEFTLRTKLKVKKYPYLVRSLKYPWMIADFDYVSVGGKIKFLLEIKTTSEYMKDTWLDQEELPPIVKCQVHHYMVVGDFKQAYVCVLIGGQKFHMVKVEREKQFEKELIAEEKLFWEKVVSQTLPDPDNTPEFGRALSLYYKDTKKEPEIILPEDFNASIWYRDSLKDSIKGQEGTVTLIENKVKSEMKEFEIGVTSDWLITWKPNKNGDRRLKIRLRSTEEKEVKK